MSSKELYPWELSYRVVAEWLDMSKQESSFAFLWIEDPYIQRLVHAYVKKWFKGNITYLLPEELNLSLIEEIETPDLFSSLEGEQSSLFIVLRASMLSKETGQLLVDKGYRLQEEKIFFLLSGDKKGAIGIDGPCLKIMPPRFWESRQLFQFWQRALQISLPASLADQIFESTEGDSGNYVQVLNLFRYNPSLLLKKDIGDVLGGPLVDRFALATALGLKQWSRFYDSLLMIDGWDLKREILSFLKSHLAKIGDPHYLGKKRPSQYDRKIEKERTLWEREDIIQMVEHLSYWEVLAKKRDQRLISLWREKQLQGLCPVQSRFY